MSPNRDSDERSDPIAELDKYGQLVYQILNRGTVLAETIRRSPKGQDTLTKGDQSPVTLADYTVQIYGCGLIHQAFPDDFIVAEEETDKTRWPQVEDQIYHLVHNLLPYLDKSDLAGTLNLGRTTGDVPSRYWTIDPIDGTRGFVQGRQYAVAVALIEDGRPVVGGLACCDPESTPDRDTCISTQVVVQRGKGVVRHIVVPHEESRPIEVSRRSDGADLILCESLEGKHTRHSDSAALAGVLGITEPPLQMDSQAKYLAVAEGRADIYLRLPSSAHYREKVWDHGAGSIIVEEAGGKVTDIVGRPLDFSHGPTLLQNRGILATNGHCHQMVLDGLKEVLDLEREGAIE